MSCESNHDPRFLATYKEQDDVIAFYTGFPDFAAMNLCYKLVDESAKNISYKVEGVYDDCRNSPQQVGRPRVLTTFQEYTLVMMRLRLRLFERDLAHRFNVSIMTVSRVTRAWFGF